MYGAIKLNIVQSEMLWHFHGINEQNGDILLRGHFVWLRLVGVYL